MTSNCARSVPSWCGLGPTVGHAEVDERDTPGRGRPGRDRVARGDHDRVRFDSLVRDAQLAEGRQRRPCLTHPRLVERRDRPAQHEQRVVHACLARGLDLAAGDAAAGGEERDERLVLGGFELAERAGRAEPAIPDSPPHPREQLPVVRVAPVDLDQQRPAERVATRPRGRPRRRGARRPPAHPPRRPATPARAPRPVSPGRPADVPHASRTAAATATAIASAAAMPLGVPPAVTVAPITPSSRTRRPKTWSGCDEVGRDRHGDRRRLAHPQRREARVRPIADGEPGRQRRHQRSQHERSQRLPDHHPPPPDQREDHQRGGPQPQRAREQLPDGIQPPGQRGQQPHQRPLQPVRRIRHDRERQHQHGGHQQDDVGPPPHPRLVDRRGEHPPRQNDQKTGTSRTATTPKSTSIGSPSFQ